jgi:hypothetical protein
MACEDQSALIQARRIHHQVESLCGGEAEVTRALWSFALLRHEQLRAYAISEAANAEMVIISLHGSAELPSHVKTFLGNLSGRSQAGQGALVLLLGARTADHADRQSLIGFLREIAEKRSLDFFCNRDDWPNLDLSQAAFSEMETAAVERLNLITHHLPWNTGGIND